MSKKTVFYLLGIVVCLLIAFPVCAKGPKALTAAEQPAPGFDLKKSKAWIAGRVALDSGYAKAIKLSAPTLSNMFGTKLAYLNEEDGTFILEADLYCPTEQMLLYDGGRIPVYLAPNDTLHVEFASGDFLKGNDGKFSSVRYSGRNAAVNADLLAFYVHRNGKGYDQFHGAKTPEEYRVGNNALYDTYQSELRAFMDGRRCDPKFFELADREIAITKVMLACFATELFNAPITLKEAPALYVDTDKSLDDRNFMHLFHYLYYLDQLGQVPIWEADTVGMTTAEKMQVIRNSFDTLLTRYPAGLSRDAVLLMAFQRSYKHADRREELPDVFAAADRYIQSPVIREAWTEYQAPYLAAAAPKRNVHKLELRPAERFIADLFAPYRDSGKVLYVEVWRLGCGPCRAEMPYSVELHKKLEGKPVEFVYICLGGDKKYVDRDIVTLGIAGTGKNILLSDDESSILMNCFGFEGTPYYWIVDKNGDVVLQSSRVRPSEPTTYDTLLKLADR